MGIQRTRQVWQEWVHNLIPEWTEIELTGEVIRRDLACRGLVAWAVPRTCGGYTLELSKEYQWNSAALEKKLHAT